MMAFTPRCTAPAVLAACLLAVPGCASSVDGSPGPAATTTTPTTSQDPVRPSTTPPPSGPLTAAGIDPCALLDDAAQAQLGVTSSGPTDSSDFDGATCRFVLDDQRRLNATATDGVSLPELVAESDRQGRTTTPTSVRTLDAATSYAADRPTLCTAAVGVSETGMVVITYEDTAAAAEDTTCGRALDVADLALDGLIAQQ